MPEDPLDDIDETSVEKDEIVPGDQFLAENGRRQGAREMDFKDEKNRFQEEGGVQKCSYGTIAGVENCKKSS